MQPSSSEANCGSDSTSDDVGSSICYLNPKYSFSDSFLVALSPHPDDIAYSIGGLVSQFPSSLRWVLLTVFTKSAYAPGLIKKLTADEISSFRCKEDLDYAKSVGATHCSLDFPDASLCGYTDETELTNDYHDSRFGPVGLAINKSLLELRPDIVLAPLAVGGHIDHRIVLEALRLSVWGKCARVYFYEDLPYAAVLEPASLRAQVATNSGEVKPVVCDISKVLEYKRKALSFYASQQASKNETMLLKYARSIVRGTYSERLWVSDV